MGVVVDPVLETPWNEWRKTIAEQFDGIASEKQFSFPLNKVQAAAIMKPVKQDYDGSLPESKVEELYEAWHEAVASGEREVIPW